MDPTVSAEGGWTRDLPDPRDYTLQHKRVQAILGPLKSPRRPIGRLTSVNWEEYCPPVWSCRGLAAGAALAVAALAGYYERRSMGRPFLPSWLFLYKMARVLSLQPGNSCPSIRQTLKALTRFGLPPMQYGVQDPSLFDLPPEPFLFCYAREYAEVVYLRLDHPDARPQALLTALKRCLAAGFPVVFGASTFAPASPGPILPFPCEDETLGGAAFVAVGFDDGTRVGSEKGALRVRTPWGPDWGEQGYGWLPYRYLDAQLVADFWMILRPDWVAAGDFPSPL